MKKIRLYMTAMVIMAGVAMWEAPLLVHAEPVMVEANEIEEDIEDTEEEDQQSPVMEAASETDDTTESGPDLVVQAQAEAKARQEAEAEASQNMVNVRQNLVSYALQFVGGPYRSGGNDPHTGVDCSGFVKYVMQNGAGVAMNRSSSTQATQGRAINANQMQPGDLIFYGSGSRINHVAMYIGNGQIVHASTYKTGIKISNWNYRTPVKIISVLG